MQIPPLLQLKGSRLWAASRMSGGSQPGGLSRSGVDPTPQPHPAAQSRPAPGLQLAPLGLLSSPRGLATVAGSLLPASAPPDCLSCPSTTSSPLRHPVRAKGISSPALWCTTTACSTDGLVSHPRPALGHCFRSEPQFRCMLLKRRLPAVPPGAPENGLLQQESLLQHGQRLKCVGPALQSHARAGLRLVTHNDTRATF